MRMLSGKVLYWGLGVIGSMTLVSLSPVGPLKANQPDPYRETWGLHAQSIRTFEATFARTRSDRPGKPPQQHWLRMDFETGWCRGSVMRSVARDGKDEILEDEYGLHAQASWQGTRMKDGARRFDITAPEKGLPQGTRLAELGVPWVRYCLLPYHCVIQKEDPNATVSLVSRAASTKYPAAEHLTYRVITHGIALDVSYDAQFDDGVRVYQTDVLENGQPAESIVNQDFQKQNGIWVAHKSEYRQHASAEGMEPAPDQWSIVEIASITVNPTFTSDDFRPAFLNGDKVVDAITGMKYRVGSTDMNVDKDLAKLTPESAGTKDMGPRTGAGPKTGSSPGVAAATAGAQGQQPAADAHAANALSAGSPVTRPFGLMPKIGLAGVVILLLAGGLWLHCRKTSA